MNETFSKKFSTSRFFFCLIGKVFIIPTCRLIRQCNLMQELLILTYKLREEKKICL